MKTELLKIVKAELKAFEAFNFVKNNVAGSADVYQLRNAKKLLLNSKLYVSELQYKDLTAFFEFTRQRMTVKKGAFNEAELLETKYL